MSGLPPLPPGFQLEGAGNAPAPAALPPLPDGFVLEGANPQSVVPQGDTSMLGDIAKAGGIGLAKGLIGIAGLPGDLPNLAAKTYDYFSGGNAEASTQPFANQFGAAALQKDIEEKTGPFYQPQTTAGQYAQTIGEFAPAAFGGEASIPARLATRVVLPAVGSEAAGEATEGTSLEPVARVGGALVGAGLPSLASRVISPTTIDATNQAAVNTLENEGVTSLTAGQKSGSKVLKYAESELGDSFGAGSQATKTNDLALQQFTQAALRRAGVTAERANARSDGRRARRQWNRIQ